MNLDKKIILSAAILGASCLEAFADSSQSTQSSSLSSEIKTFLTDPDTYIILAGSVSGSLASLVKPFKTFSDYIFRCANKASMNY